MIETRTLTVEEWPLVAGIMRGEFGDCMPTLPEQATFLAGFEGRHLACFVHLEWLYHFNDIYVAPEYRGQGLGWRLAREADSLVPAGHSAVVFSDRASQARLLQRLGGRDLGPTRLIRKDYF